MRPINLIVIHCSASPDGQSLARFSPGGGAALTAAQTIDGWHQSRGITRAPDAVSRLNPHLPHIGYHFVIDVDGDIQIGRDLSEIGAHARGFDTASIGICLVGTDRFTAAQWTALRELLAGKGRPEVEFGFPGMARFLRIPLRSPERIWPAGGARVQVRNGVCGHNELWPDQSRNNTMERADRYAACPGFSVADWLRDGLQAIDAAVFNGDASTDGAIHA